MCKQMKKEPCFVELTHTLTNQLKLPETRCFPGGGTVVPVLKLEGPLCPFYRHYYTSMPFSRCLAASAASLAFFLATSFAMSLYFCLYRFKVL